MRLAAGGSRGNVAVVETALGDAELGARLEEHRRELHAYCYRMLASPFEAEDAVQETMIRAWRGYKGFEGRAALRSWLYRIATNVCFDLLSGRERRPRPMDLGPAGAPVFENLNVPAEVTWLQPVPTPEEAAVESDSLRLAFVAALQHLPPRQRAALILAEVLRWQATEIAELLETTTASVNSALQRARATIASRDMTEAAPLGPEERELLERYVAAFQDYDIDRLTALIREDAIQSMPPFDLWLSGRDDIFTWWLGPGIGCKGSRLVPVGYANGAPAWGQYKPDPENGGYMPWALMVVELSGGLIGELTFFLDVDRLFPLFGLPPRLEA
jgi:RNA polymerase sigma-70 factor (ECF subfamily)